MLVVEVVLLFLAVALKALVEQVAVLQEVIIKLLEMRVQQTQVAAVAERVGIT
jgi:hypothetical protein